MDGPLPGHPGQQGPRDVEHQPNHIVSKG
jgi:hypothetical protein